MSPKGSHSDNKTRDLCGESSIRICTDLFFIIYYGYLCDLHGSRVQLSSARLAENQTGSLTQGTLLKIFRLD